MQKFNMAVEDKGDISVMEVSYREPFEFMGQTFVCHKGPGGENTVSEYKTGRSIVSGDSYKTLKEVAKEKIRVNCPTEADLKSFIDKFEIIN